jgi:hypothetical protein
MAGKPLTTSLNAGVPLRDEQDAASHADPRTTMRYDRARASLDRHATYIVAAYVAGAAAEPPPSCPPGRRPGQAGRTSFPSQIVTASCAREPPFCAISSSLMASS